MKLFFWRRFGAAWIDVFLVYAGVSFLLALGALAGLRVSLEPLFVIGAVVYGAVCLSRNGQTVGKTLFGIAVESTTGGRPTVTQVLVREVLGKWLISVVVPVAFARVLLKAAWVPTVFDAFVLGLVVAVLTVYSLLAKRPWYDSMAGTAVRRAPAMGWSPKVSALVLLAAALLGLGSKAVEYTICGQLSCHLALHQSMRSTKPYVDFLKGKRTAPVDYVLGLFDRFDVVVLCERFHPEASQWDFIFEVVKDPRFADRVGHVFTEYGNSAMQDSLDQFMETDGMPPTDVQARAVHLMRHWSVWPTWPNVNFYNYLVRLYALNQSLPAAKRIRHHFTDVPVNWAQLTAETMPKHWQAMADRDEQMARQVVDGMRRLARPGKPAKCLVVMNFRHAFDITGGRPGAKRRNTCEFIRDAMPDRVANVLLNTSVIFLAPIAGGLWDAAFEATGNRPAGFDFARSPFGEDPFDLFLFAPPVQARFRYRDVFTGFVFAQPLKDQYSETGIPGYYGGFEPEMRRRAALLGKDYSGGVEHEIRQEQQGHVNRKQPVFNFRFATCIELSLLGLASVGFVIGLVACLTGRARERCDPPSCTFPAAP